MNKSKEAKKLDKTLITAWRKLSLERDGNCCVMCGNKERTNVHHIISRSVKSLKYDVENGICLCALHHMFDRKISAHKGSMMFINWLINHRTKQYMYLLEFMNEESLYEERSVL